MNATNVVNKTIELLGKSLGDIEGALEATSPGADGLVYLPFLNGERTPDLPNARGSLHGMSPTNLSSANLIRATIEGVSFGILNGLDLVLEGRKADVIKVIGGGSRSRAWRQLLADATGAVIHVPTEEEAGCLGAAIQAMVAVSHRTGIPRDFIAVADGLVRIDETATCVPREELLPAYQRARSAYARQVEAQYPTSSS
jgi:xylulokinase